MNLPDLRANVDFSQSSLSSERTEAYWPRAPKLFESRFLEKTGRVLQAPSRERPLAARRVKSTLSEQTGRFIVLAGPIKNLVVEVCFGSSPRFYRYIRRHKTVWAFRGSEV